MVRQLPSILYKGCHCCHPWNQTVLSFWAQSPSSFPPLVWLSLLSVQTSMGVASTFIIGMCTMNENKGISLSPATKHLIRFWLMIAGKRAQQPIEIGTQLQITPLGNLVVHPDTPSTHARINKLQVHMAGRSTNGRF